MLRVRYPQHMIDKAQSIVDESEGLGFRDRDRYCRHRVGLSHRYMSKIGDGMDHPSDRTLLRLGYTLLARDNATGELIELESELKCDYANENPKANLTSTKVFVGEPYRTSTLKELNLRMKADSQTSTLSSETPSPQ